MAAREDLREFLRSRRGRVTPEDVGLDPGRGPRRVPGLRREELARLAGVSVDYYTRLEQGRDINVSSDVLQAIATALRLEDAERDHLFDLARPTRARRRSAASPTQRVRPGMQVLLESLSTPAFVVGRRSDVLASNRPARSLICDFEALPPAERNHARWVFLDPVARDRYLDWPLVARETVASLRMDAGRHPDDPQLAALIGELTMRSAEFAEWWADHDVKVLSHGTKRYHHPIVGDLTVSYEALPIPDAVDQTLFIYTAEPHSPSEQALQLLANWALGDDAAPEPETPSASGRPHQAPPARPPRNAR